MSVKRIYVEKKAPFAVEAQGVLSDLRTALMVDTVEQVRILNRYDVEGLSDEDFTSAIDVVFSEPQVDNYLFELPELAPDEQIFASEYLPGQFDQRADSCAQCIQIMTQKNRPLVRTARVFILKGNLTGDTLDKIKRYLINPVESREALLVEVPTLEVSYEIPTTVKTLQGFTALNESGLQAFLNEMGLAMDLDDLKFCQDYFKNTERRDPTITEIRMIDTYWSDHCRHTTFLTNIDHVEIKDATIQKSYELYLSLRDKLYAGKDKPMTLMDLAVIGAKALKAQGDLTDLDESEEINACSVKIKVDRNNVLEDWLLMFKNETHNHPTEIEPFGGAATCLGGAIRDPLSGRSYVYQAMRVTGASDPLVPVAQTIAGKLPQRKIVTTAAAGYSSYGNQIGLATGQVNEIYHPGYVAKRMEIGAVIGAAPAKNVRRECPVPGDVIILLGGKTGRDGCGGATGSSKSHTLESLDSCGAEVQKGNPPEERKLQRLFRNPEVTAMIKRCNDFGAGGISVAIGELADGLTIDLDKVEKKYNGLDGTELAISESQERMAVVVAKEDVDRFISEAHLENLDATPVAVVEENPRLVMNWSGNTIVNLSREFLNSNGAQKHTDVKVEGAKAFSVPHSDLPIQERLIAHMSDLNICSQKGLVERFDSTIGAGSVLMPYGGIHQMTPSQAMAAKIPVLDGFTHTCSLMAWGYNPYLSSASPYHGAVCAVVESIAKLVAAGGSHEKCWLTFQEYFERTKDDPTRWGKPFAALLGALQAQMSLKIGAIGGKDSMSGTFEEIDVPPTLVSFAVSVADVRNVISTHFKGPDNNLYLITPRYDENGMPDFDSVLEVFSQVEKLICKKQVWSAYALGYGGVAEAVCKMCFGNRVGVNLYEPLPDELAFAPVYGGFVLEAVGEINLPGAKKIGQTIEEYCVTAKNEKVDLAEIQKAYETKLEPVFPAKVPTTKEFIPTYSYGDKAKFRPAVKIAKPRVLIPVFPGTNCEYDTARAYESAGAKAEIFVVRNRTQSDIEESVKAFAALLSQSQIVALPGGFSGGDEPDGSGKFIVAFFRNPAVMDAVHTLLKERDGLMCGICNGFQALIKLGLVPYGEITAPDANSPTLTFNTIGRHQSMLVRTRVSSVKSPWLMYNKVGDIHTVPISHGEGRFVADQKLIEKLAANGQIATQYVDLSGAPTMDIRFNPNGSICAIEGITSPDGRVFGKMAHSERYASHLYQNVAGQKDQMLFAGAVDYFTK